MNVNRVLVYLLIGCGLSIFLFSCSSIEKEAENQMRKTVLELAKNPDTYKISNVKTIYKSPTDSLVVLSFMGKGQNGFGGYSSSYCEYFYYLSLNGEIYENLVDLDDEKEESFRDLKRSSLMSFYPDSLYDRGIYFVVGLHTMINGREVE